MEYGIVKAARARPLLARIQGEKNVLFMADRDALSMSPMDPYRIICQRFHRHADNVSATNVISDTVLVR